MPHDMYFLAVLCPDELDKKILVIKHWIKEHTGSVVALKSPAHITLIQPFWLEADREEQLQNALREFRSDREELEIRVEGFSHFGKRVLFACIQENPSLQESPPAPLPGLLGYE